MIGWLFQKPLPPGTVAPDFELPDEAGNLVSLKAYRGRSVILVWYPGDDTTLCTRQLCALRDEWTALSKAGVAALGINPQNAASHTRFKQKYSLPFPLLVDRHQRAGRLYHAYGWIVRRTVYLIDPQGIIRYASRGNPSIETILSGTSAAPASSAPHG